MNAEAKQVTSQFWVSCFLGAALAATSCSFIWFAHWQSAHAYWLSVVLLAFAYGIFPEAKKWKHRVGMRIAASLGVLSAGVFLGMMNDAFVHLAKGNELVTPLFMGSMVIAGLLGFSRANALN